MFQQAPCSCYVVLYISLARYAAPITPRGFLSTNSAVYTYLYMYIELLINRVRAYNNTYIYLPTRSEKSQATNLRQKERT